MRIRPRNARSAGRANARGGRSGQVRRSSTPSSAVADARQQAPSLQNKILKFLAKTSTRAWTPRASFNASIQPRPDVYHRHRGRGEGQQEALHRTTARRQPSTSLPSSLMSCHEAPQQRTVQIFGSFHCQVLFCLVCNGQFLPTYSIGFKVIRF